MYLFWGRVDGQIGHLWGSVGHRGREGRSGGRVRVRVRVRLWLGLDWGAVFRLVHLWSTLQLLSTEQDNER